jgi:5-methylphenazine-1-carboxylate 1-monooxygenase
VTPPPVGVDVDPDVDLGGDGIAIVGAGIGGLVTALSLHQVGIEATVFESVDAIRPAGVGINLLPHSIRELDALGLLDELSAHAIEPSTLAYFAKNGREIWSEPRGRAAGYAWPQLSIHRGDLHRILLDALRARAGVDAIRLGHRLVDVRSDDHSATATFDGPSRSTVRVRARAVVAADGIHSAARSQFYPDQGPPKWSGALLWRGVVDREPVLDGRTMIWIGHPAQKFVGYPIADLDHSQTAPRRGRQTFNFIAELRPDDTELTDREDWNRPGNLADFLPAFESWVFDWLDVPALIRAAAQTFVFPMIDRDPVDRWTFERVTLLGDAAHPMYPIGSNGASQAILDARVLAGCLRSHPLDVVAALARYEQVRLPPTSAIVEANRGLGPERPMQLVEQRAPDGFERIEDVISSDEILEITDGYRRTAGFALAALDDPTSLADRDYRVTTT